MKSAFRNIQENTGSRGAIIIPMHLCKKIEDAIEMSIVENDLIEESKVLSKFQISKKTLQNNLRKLRGCYTTAFNGSRWWYLSRLLGIKNILSRKKVA